MNQMKRRFAMALTIALLASCSSSENENNDLSDPEKDMSSPKDSGENDMLRSENLDCHSQDSETCTLAENCGRVTAFRVVYSQTDDSCMKGELYRAYCSTDEVPSMPIRYFKKTSNGEPAQVIWLNNSYDAPPNDGEWIPCPGSMSETTPEECYCNL